MRCKALTSALAALLLSLTFAQAGGAASLFVSDRKAEAGDLTRLEFNLSAAAKPGEPVTLHVPVSRRDVSVLLTVLADRPTYEVSVLEIRDPAGQLLYAADSAAIQVPYVNAGFPQALAALGELNVLLPSHPDMAVTPGTYRVRLQSLGRLQRVTALVKKGLAARQLIDIAIWAGVTEDSRFYPGDAFDPLIAAVRQTLAPHGISVGSVTINSATAAEREALNGPVYHTLDDLCAFMKGRIAPENRSLQVLWLDRLRFSDGEELGGLSSAQPGTMMLRDGRNTCVAVGRNALGSNLQLEMATVLHEALHFMGLPHTSEETGDSFDHFRDTPECHLSVNDGRPNLKLGLAGDINGQIDDHECREEGGARNLMFPNGGVDFMPFHLTPQQAWVLKRHPLLYPDAQ